MRTVSLRWDDTRDYVTPATLISNCELPRAVKATQSSESYFQLLFSTEIFDAANLSDDLSGEFTPLYYII